MLSRDLSRDQVKLLRGQRITDILNNSSLLEDCRSFDARTAAATLETKSQPRFHAGTSVSHLKPAETAIMGYFSGGSIANIVQ